MGLDEDRKPLTKEEALAFIENIETDILDDDLDETDVATDEEETDIATNINFGNLDNINNLHPYEASKLIISTLHSIKKSADNYANLKNADWGRFSLAAVKEVRLALRDIMPVYEEMESRFNQKKEEWIDKLIDFNCEYVVANYGEHAMVDYMMELDKFRKAIDNE